MKTLPSLILAVLCIFSACNSKNNSQSTSSEVADDSINTVVRKDIHRELADKIKPVIIKWLEYNDADIYKFYCINCEEQDTLSNLPEISFEEDTASVHRKMYDKKTDDIYQPVLYDYSPDKNSYLNLLETSGVYKEGNKWYYHGGDDCQEIYLVNRKAGEKSMILWLGSGSFAEAVFWVDNDTSVIVGREFNDSPRLFMWLRGVFYYLDKDNIPGVSYFEQDAKSRGIITT